MAVPQLTLLPDPPLLTDDEDTYNIKADATVVAQQKSIPEINLSLIWIGQQVTAVNDYRQQAAQSATDAQKAASAANDSKVAAAKSASDATTNGQAQVDLAKAQVTLAAEQARLATANGRAQVQFAAEQAQLATTNGQAQVAAAGQVKEQTAAIRDQAQIIADAARAAVGIASYTNKKGYVFTVSDDGTSIQWRPRHRIGEVLQAAGPIDSTFLPLTGGLYLQSAYPELFAKVGLLGAQAGDSWAAVATTPVQFQRINIGKNRVLMAAPYAQTSTLYRSEDDGKTWSSVTVSAALNGSTGAGLYDVVSDGKGIWIGIGYLSSLSWFTLRSTDNGLTWTRVSSGVSGLPVRIATDGNGTWLAVGGTSSATAIRSDNNGVTWSVVLNQGSGSAGGVATDGLGNWMIGSGGGAFVSVNNGVSFTLKSVSNSVGNVTNVYDVVTDKKGIWLLSFYVASGSSAGLLKSYNFGSDWQAVPITGGGTVARMGGTDGNGAWYFAAGTGRVFVSRDNTITWSVISAVTTKLPSGNDTEIIVMSGSDVLASGLTALTRSNAVTPYDNTTLFQLPNVIAYKGLGAYIKAKEAA
ncbi:MULTISPECIES: WD40/YVTN/BNR-like repeat-containing protein [unclassified Pseudomonas]|uniref:WD40/YVTN/BNR-like repeat-containing protein n=1 Tax=unclassified Pseudomonas TaxID=196821 RepID=UPI0025D44CFD|nr:MULTISPECIES: hypothetical protein [unclassified Pseudomonas]